MYNLRFEISNLKLPAVNRLKSQRAGRLFMQNKANFPKSQMNVSIFSKKDYENISDWTLSENKPNSNPIKPNLQESKIDAKCVFTKEYEEKCG